MNVSTNVACSCEISAIDSEGAIERQPDSLCTFRTANNAAIEGARKFASTKSVAFSKRLSSIAMLMANVVQPVPLPADPTAST